MLHLILFFFFLFFFLFDYLENNYLHWKLYYFKLNDNINKFLLFVVASFFLLLNVYSVGIYKLNFHIFFFLFLFWTLSKQFFIIFNLYDCPQNGNIVSLSRRRTGLIFGKHYEFNFREAYNMSECLLSSHSWSLASPFALKSTQVAPILLAKIPTE